MLTQANHITLTHNSVNNTNRPANGNPPPEAPCNQNQQPPAAIHALKKPKTSHLAITNYFAKAVDNPNFTALEAAARNPPPTAGSFAIPHGRNSVNRNGHGGRRENSGRKRKAHLANEDKDNEADNEHSGSATNATSTIASIPLPPPLPLFPAPQIYLAGIESLAWSAEDEPSSNSDESEPECTQNPPIFLDSDDSDIELADEVAGAVDPDTIPVIVLDGDNDGDPGEPEMNPPSLKRGFSTLYPPDEPYKVLIQMLLQGLPPSPDPFCIPAVYFFESHIGAGVLPCCANASCLQFAKNAKMGFRGWSSRPWRLFGTGRKSVYYMFTARYKCSSCDKECDLELTWRLLSTLMMGPGAARNKFAKHFRKRHTKDFLCYHSTIETYFRQYQRQPTANANAFKFPTNPDGSLKVSAIKPFPDFFDPYYGGEVMCEAWLLKMFVQLQKSRQSYMDGEIQRRVSSHGIYAIDHTFQVCHGLSCQNGQRPIECVFNQRNDNGELRLNHLLPSAGHSAAEVPLKSAKTSAPSLQSRVKGLDFSSPATDFEVVYYGRENTTALGLKCSSLLEFEKLHRVFMSVDCEWDTLNHGKVGKVPVLTFACPHSELDLASR
ncbi:hypothetical protein BDR26DRAFT_931000 [Obelidium mucronatum]|nr:hypothetical protein BDR26DRAFT_931000 [Obelidium mucronatum]